MNDEEMILHLFRVYDGAELQQAVLTYVRSSAAHSRSVIHDLQDKAIAVNEYAARLERAIEFVAGALARGPVNAEQCIDRLRSAQDMRPIAALEQGGSSLATLEREKAELAKMEARS